MNFALIVSIIFGCFILQNQAFLDGEEDVGSSSSSTSATSEAASTGVTSVTSSPGAETTSENILGSTVSSNPSESSQTPESGASTQKSTTKTNGPTTPAAAPTEADIWAAEFSIDCNTTKDYCVYEIKAPQLDAHTFNEDNSQLGTDESSILTASSKAYYDSLSFYSSKVMQDYKDIKERVDELKKALDDLNNTVQDAVQNAENQTIFLNEALQNISAIYSDLGTCYYQKCALATPPPTTTTTTPRPTTPGICFNYKCESPAPYASGTCVPIGSKPSCQCPGNLDQTANCAKVGCPKNGYKDGTVPGPLWSPGYIRGLNQTYAPKLNCNYKISHGKPLKITARSFQIDSSAKLNINNKQILSSFTLDTLNNFLTKVIGNATTSITISFTTGATVPNGAYFFDWDVNEI